MMMDQGIDTNWARKAKVYFFTKTGLEWEIFFD